MLKALQKVPRVDLVFANAGVFEPSMFFLHDEVDNNGMLVEPKFESINVNHTGVLNLLKITIFMMRKHKSGGSIVVTSSSTSYSSEASTPLFSAVKASVSRKS